MKRVYVSSKDYITTLQRPPLQSQETTDPDKRTAFQREPLEFNTAPHITLPEILFSLLLAGHVSLAVLDA